MIETIQDILITLKDVAIIFAVFYGIYQIKSIRLKIKKTSLELEKMKQENSLVKAYPIEEANKIIKEFNEFKRKERERLDYIRQIRKAEDILSLLPNVEESQKLSELAKLETAKAINEAIKLCKELHENEAVDKDLVESLREIMRTLSMAIRAQYDYMHGGPMYELKSLYDIVQAHKKREES